MILGRASHEVGCPLQRDGRVMPPRVVLAEHDTKLVRHAEALPWSTSGSLSAFFSASAPSFTIGVAQL